MSNIVSLRPSPNSPAEGLRAIADQIDSGEIKCRRVTLVIGTEVFHLDGSNKEDAAAEATVFDLNIGLARMMYMLNGVYHGEDEE